MKELEGHKSIVKTPVVQEIKKRQKHEYKHEGSIRLIRGLTLWEYDYMEKTLKKVELDKKVALGLDKKAKSSIQAQYNPKAMYIQALNRKVAIKKLNKQFDKLNYFLRIVDFGCDSLIGYKIIRL